MNRRSFVRPFLIVQCVVVAAFAVAYAAGSPPMIRLVQQELAGVEPFRPLELPRNEPLFVTPLYDRPDLVSDEDLALVLKAVRPIFPRQHLKPNFVEHALRVWGVDATFEDPAVLSGADLRDFLTDNGAFEKSWGGEAAPLLEDRPQGIAVRWGKVAGGSVHHDHWLASLTEAGVHRDDPVYGPARRNSTIADVVEESLRDFRLDEKESEWTAMAFGLWIPPAREWTGGDGRSYSFDLIAQRLLRGRKDLGVCHGTHRVYSLMLLVRIDDEHDILSDAVRGLIRTQLEEVRDAILVSQFDDGHWPSNWHEGADAVAHPVEDELHTQVIATGHHLEWLAIAPPDLHPPDAQIEKAVDWLVRTTGSLSQDQIIEKYTFFSHVGNALALWRHTRPATFWKSWTAAHPAQ